MGAYGNIEKGVAGLLTAVATKVESWIAQESIFFGRPVFAYVGDDSKVYNYINDTGKLVFDGDFVTANVITITVNGTATAGIPFNTDHDTTMDDVLAAIQGIANIEAALDADDANNRTFIIREKGVKAVVSEDVTGGAGQATGTVTYGSSQVFVGVSAKTDKEPLDTTNGNYYEAQDPVNVLVDGSILGVNGAAVDSQNTPYVITVEGATLGQFGAAGEALTGYYKETLSGAGLVELRVDGQKKMTYADIAFA